ncbi:MAG: hypothetical protein F2667_14655, partial [Actinobacteria bacterium]|nr:hypothetical protein [Actinomycetota bacterium]
SVGEMLAAEAGTTCDRARLQALSVHRLTAVRAAVARNPHASRALLVELARDRHHLVRYAVAQNRGPFAEQVALGAADRSVRVILAQRRDLDASTYESLVVDSAHEVREAVVASSRSPDLVVRLAADPHPGVRSVVAHHDLCPDELIDVLSRDRDARVRGSVASTRRLSEEMIARLLVDRSAAVRWNLLTHHPGRRDIAEALAADPDELTAVQARHQLAPGPQIGSA